MCLVVRVIFSKCHHPAYYRLIDACHAGFVHATTTAPAPAPAPIPRGTPTPRTPAELAQLSQTDLPPNTTTTTTTTTINSCLLGNNDPLPTYRRTRVPYCRACIAVEEDKILYQYESEVRATLASLKDTTLDFQEMYGVGYVSVKRLERKMMRELESWWEESAVPRGGKTRFLARVGERAKLVVFYQDKITEM